MKLSQCRPGIAVCINHSIFNWSDHLVYMQPQGIITENKIHLETKKIYRYTMEHNKMKKIFLPEVKVGVMLTNGTEVFEFPENLTKYVKR